MPTIYDTIINEDPLVRAQRAARERLAAQQAEANRNFQTGVSSLSPRAQEGAVAGRALGNLASLFFDGDPEDQIDESPEVQRVRSNQALIQQYRKLAEEVDPTSSEYAVRAGRLAKEAGRDDLALQFAAEAGTLRKKEAKLAEEAAQQELENKRASINTLPSAQKYSYIVNNKDEVGELYGLEGKQLDAFVKDAADTLSTIRKKNSAELNKIEVVNPPSVTGADTNQTIELLDAAGYDKDTFDNAITGDGEKEQRAFAQRVTEQAKTEQAILAKREKRNVPLPEIIDDIMGTLTQTEAFVPAPYFGKGEIDGAEISNIFRQRINSLESATAEQRSTGDQPPVPGARKAGDGNWYVERDGQFFRVTQ